MPTQQSKLGSIGNPIKFRNQDYKTLLDECLKSGSLFSDPTFVVDQSSIGMPEDPDPSKQIKWLRPKVYHVIVGPLGKVVITFWFNATMLSFPVIQEI